MGLTTLFAVIVIFGCFVAAIRIPIAGIVGYFVIYATYSTKTWYGYQLQTVFLRPSLLAAAVLLISCIINHNQLSWKISRKEIEIYLFAITAFVVSHFFGVYVTEDSDFYIEKLFKVSLFIFLMIRTVNTIDKFNIMLWPFIGGSIFLCWQAQQIGGFHDGRLNNIGGVDFSEANAFASFLIFSVILLGFKLFKAPLWKKGIIVVCIGVLSKTFIMTQSRAVFMGLFFGGCYVLFSSPRKIRIQILIYAAAALVMLSILASENFWNRMGSIDDQAGKISQTDALINEQVELSRIDYWKSSIYIFKDHPMGIGVKNFTNVVPLYDPRNPGMDAHNTYVLCYTELGVAGGALFLIILFETFLQFRRIKKMIRYLADPFDVEMLFFSLTSFVIVYTTGPMVTHSYLYSEFLWIILALPICLEQAVRQEIHSETA